MATVTRYALAHRTGDVPLSNLTVPQAVDWSEWLAKQRSTRGTPLAPFSVRNITACVRSLVADVQGKGWADVKENPFAHRHVSQRTKGAQRVCGDDIIHLSATQATKLLSSRSPSIPPVRRACTALALFTGLRAAELQGLRISDLHLDAPVPYVDVQRQLRSPGPLETATFKPPLEDMIVQPERVAMVVTPSFPPGARTGGPSRHPSAQRGGTTTSLMGATLMPAG